VSAPLEALGTDIGFIEITMTLDSNTSVTQTAILAIEAERTRGLSLRGAEGTANSNGMGIPGEDAAAWILVENLGNAPETVSLQWQQTVWDQFITLHDSSGQEVNPLILDPNEIRELTARHSVPSSVTLGDNVSTQLSMCIGVGDDEECRTIDLTFTANQVQILPPHIRSVPADDRIWDVEIQLPTGVAEMEWDMASAGMILPGWTWEATGALSIDGTTLRVTGNTGARVVGSLILDMPFAAPPMLHTWTEAEANNSGCILSLSLQVLQIHRAVIEVTSPTEQPHRMDVGEMENIVLRLTNPGNGPDAYDLSWSVIQNQNFSEDPGLDVVLPANYSLDAGELRTIPVQLTLPEDMAAAVVLMLRFEMRSIVDYEVYSTTDILLEARQDHRWEMKLEMNGVQIENGGAINADPDSQLSFVLAVNNSGNLVDHIDIIPEIFLDLEGDDEGLGWTAWGASSGSVLVNDTQNLSIGVNTSATAWRDTNATISFNGLSDDTPIAPFVVHIRINHTPGWWVLAGGADLDVDRNGANITLIVEQRGNSPAAPFISGWVDAGGWNINISANLPLLSPGESANFTCEIIPPDGAISGHTVELTLRAKNDDGSGMGQTTLPLRVAAWHQYSLEHDENWTISPTGGLPLAMLSNLGNAPTTIDIEILGLPSGWTLSGPNQVSLGVGESSGIPLSAIPPSPTPEGDYNTSVTLRTIDEIGTQEEVELTLIRSDRAWYTSPVLFGTSGDALELEFHPGFDVSVVQQGSSTLPQTDDGGWLWIVPVMDSDGQVNVDGVTLDYWARVRDPPSRQGDCTVNNFHDLGPTEYLATCTIHTGTSEIQWTAILRDELGTVIDYESGTLDSNTTLANVNLSGATWNPPPGIHIVKASLYDGNGGLIAEYSREVLIRDIEWNLGITAVELREEGGKQDIVISISRENQTKLNDAICFIHLNSDDWDTRHRIDVTGELAPQIIIERPDLPVGSTVNVELYCDKPWDIDSSIDDNTNLIVLPSGITVQSEGLDIALLLGGLVVVFGTMSLLGMIRPDSGPKRVERRQRIRKRTNTKTQRQIEMPADDEEIQFEEISEDREINPEPELEIESDDDLRPTNLDEFESRLQRLRDRRGGV